MIHPSKFFFTKIKLYQIQFVPIDAMVGDVNLFFGEESEGAGEINMMIAGSEQAMYNFLLIIQWMLYAGPKDNWNATQ